MWFYKCFPFGYIIFFVLVVYVENMKQHKNNKKQLKVDLKTFKNITEVNEKLLELIKNFKHLEKIYKNDEITESVSSESEIDEIFRHNLNDKNSKEKDWQKQTFTTNDPSPDYHRTAYIYESQQDSELEGRITENEKETLVNSNEEQTAQEGSLENNAKTKTIAQNIYALDEIEPKTRPDEIVEIKIESEKKSKGIVFKPKILLIENHSKEYPINSQKTRFSVLQSEIDNINNISSSEIPIKFGNQRIVYSEQFSPETIWHEIINRPVKLNRVISSEETSKTKNTENEKHTAIILTDNTKLKSKSNLQKEDNTNRLHGSEIQQKLSNIEAEWNSTLRDGYGDACLQVPIKKCKKALKAVNKNICKTRFKCKSDFKSDFEENSKKSCVKKFSYIPSLSKEANTGDISRGKKIENEFLDATRYRHLHLKNSTKKSNLSLSNNGQNSSNQLSLRDKYEKRCQKESREKCIAACNEATDETCSKHSCDKKKKKALGKACKEECKKIFAIDNKSSESSEESGSESGSASD